VQAFFTPINFNQGNERIKKDVDLLEFFDKNINKKLIWKISINHEIIYRNFWRF